MGKCNEIENTTCFLDAKKPQPTINYCPSGALVYRLSGFLVFAIFISIAEGRVRELSAIGGGVITSPPLEQASLGFQGAALNYTRGASVELDQS